MLPSSNDWQSAYKRKRGRNNDQTKLEKNRREVH